MTRSKTFGHYVTDPAVIRDSAFELIRLIDKEPLAVRLLGLGISNLNTGDQERDQTGQQLTIEF